MKPQSCDIILTNVMSLAGMQHQGVHPGEMVSPFFSIIIPVYNVAPYLRACLDSMVAQTFSGWECLCVDDGSTDDSGKILEEYAQQDARFRVFHQQNAGVSAARNRALAAAKGAFIGFADGDDCLRASWLSTAYHALSAAPSADLLRTRLQRISAENTKPVLTETETGAVTHFVQPADCRAFLLSEAGCVGIYLSLIRAEIAKRCRFNETLRIGEDGLYACQTGFYVKELLAIDFVSYFYRSRPQAATAVPRRFEDALEFLSCLLACFEAHRTELFETAAVKCAAVRLFSRFVEWEMVAWFAYAAASRSRSAKVHRRLLRQIHKRGYLSFSALTGRWRWPMRFFLCGATAGVFRWNATLISSVWQMKQQVQRWRKTSRK